MRTGLLALLLAAAPQQEEAVDLLALVDPVKGAYGGTWTKTDKGLVSPGRSFARVVVPYVPPEEYDVTAVVERQGDSNALNLGLVAGGARFMVILDALIDGAYVGGLDLVDGKPFYANETSVKGALFKKGVPSTVLCSVRKDRIRVEVDGRGVVDWKAAPARLSLFQGWSVPPASCLLLGSWSSVVRIERLELRTVSGRGRTLEEAPPPPPDPKEVEAKIRAIFERLNADTFQARSEAQASLEALPVEWLPKLQALAEASDSPEVRFRIKLLDVPPAWGRLLRGDIRGARRTVQALADAYAEHDAALARTLEIPPAEAVAAFESLLDSRLPRIRSFALRGLFLLPAPAGLKAVELLGEPENGEAAADVLIALGDARAVPRALELFAAGGPGAGPAARVLRHLDPATALEAARRARPSDEAIRLLEAAGAEDDLLAHVKDASPFLPAAALALGRIGGPRTLAALRGMLEAAGRVDVAGVRDAEWGRRRLAELRGREALPEEEELDEIASAVGPAIRDALLAWLDVPDLKPALRRRLLPALGAVGRPEDAPRLVHALDDPRLVEAAAEGLDRLGVPSLAKTMVTVWMKSAKDVRLGALPAPAEIEEELAEILGDPEGYGEKWKAALELSARGWTPRLRAAAAGGLPKEPFDLRGYRLAGARALAARLEAADEAWIARLRAHPEPPLRTAGLWLSVRRGDDAAAAELAGTFAADLRPSIHGVFGSERLAWMDALEGEAWARAVAAEWRRRPGWDEGAAWLALRGDADARAHVEPRLAAFPEGLRRYVDVRRAAKGDEAALGRIWETIRKGGSHPEEEDAFVQGAPAAWRASALAQARLRMRHGESAVLNVALRLDDPGVVPLSRLVLEHRKADRSRYDRVLPLCIEALGRRGAKQAALELRGLLRAPDPVLRASAAGALAAIGDRAAAPFLQRLVDDPFEAERSSKGPWPRRRVWEAAMDALETVTGMKPEGSSIVERRDFWRSRNVDRR